MDVPLLSRQHGMFHRCQSDETGIRSPRDRPNGFPVLPGVFSVLPPPWTIEARWWAAALYGGTDGAIGGLDAAMLFGWIPAECTPRIRLYVPIERQRSSAGFVEAHRTRVPLWMQQRGLPVLEPTRALVDLGRIVPARRLLGIMATAVQRRDVRVDQILDLATRHRRVPGATAAGSAAVQLVGGAESITEVDLFALARACSPTAPLTQVDIFDLKQLVTTADIMWFRPPLVAGYYDGRLHLDADAQDADSIKTIHLHSLGVAPVRVTAGSLRVPELVIAAFRTELAAPPRPRNPRLRLRHRGEWLDF